MLLLLLVLAVFDASVFSAVVDNVAAWLATAPAWQGYEGEADSSGRATHQFTTAHGTFKVRCDLPTGRATIRGKLSADNATYPEDKAACQALAHALALPLDTLRVHTLETGLTAPLSAPPTAFLSTLAQSTYGPQQAPFYGTEPPRKAAHPLQYVAHSNDLRIKIYDRGTFAKLKNRPGLGNCLRFELHYLRGRRIGAVPSYDGNVTLANLIQPDVYKALAEQLRKSWNNINLPAPMNTELDYKDLMLLVSGQDSTFWESIKPGTASTTYKRLRARFRELQKAQQSKASNPYGEQIQGLIDGVITSAQI